MFEKLEETFDLLPSGAVSLPEKTAEKIPPLIVEKEDPEEINDKRDQELARNTFKKMISTSEDMLDQLVQIANGTEHPRAFEVAANLVKTITDVATKLDEVDSRKQKGKEQAPEKSTNINHNHLYVGSSEELMKMIRNKGKSEE
jgi:hypothetical protein